MTNLGQRIGKLELMHPPDRNCPACGYPASARLRIICTAHCDPLPTCTRCDRPLDHHGRPLHRSYVRVSRGIRRFTRSADAERLSRI